MTFSKLVIINISTACASDWQPLKANPILTTLTSLIDTGFSGFLTLPSSTIGHRRRYANESLDLIWKGRDLATVGDGTSCIFEVYIAVIIWNWQYGTIDINESETMPLIGMQLLRGYDLRIHAIEGGSVTIEALQIPQSGRSANE